MRFRHVRCAICALPLTVVQTPRGSTAQVNRAVWAGRCHCAREAGEPRMCVYLRRAVHDADAAQAAE